MPEIGRVLIRVPLAGALLQATARLSLDAAAGPGGETAVLDTFTNVTCHNRRTSVRLTEPVRVRLLSDGGLEIDLLAVNIGAQGILLEWLGCPEVALGERLRLSIRLDGRDIIVIGDVVRVAGAQTAIQFQEMTAEERMFIADCVFRRECELRQRERWGDRTSD